SRKRMGRRVRRRGMAGVTRDTLRGYRLALREGSGVFLAAPNMGPGGGRLGGDLGQGGAAAGLPGPRPAAPSGTNAAGGPEAAGPGPGRSPGRRGPGPLAARRGPGACRHGRQVASPGAIARTGLLIGVPAVAVIAAGGALDLGLIVFVGFLGFLTALVVLAY